MKKKKRFKKVCPQCGSIDIGIPPAGLDLRMTIRDYCRKCKNIGNFPEAEEDKIDDFRMNINQESDSS